MAQTSNSGQPLYLPPADCFPTCAAWATQAIGAAQTAGFSLLRFGGTGNDYLTYEFGGAACPPPSGPEGIKQCLNQTTWAELLSFTAAGQPWPAAAAPCGESRLPQL